MRQAGAVREGAGLPAAGLAALGVVTLALVVLSASSGSVNPVSESTAVRTPDVFVPGDEVTPTPGPTPTPWQPPGTGWTAPAWVGAAVEIIVLTALLVALFLLLRVMIRAVVRVLREVELPEPETNDAANWQRVTRAELSEAVTTGVDQIESGTPSDAIVACWLALERAAADAGVARAPSETPAELTVRVLAACWVSRAALERLADLYREARFSTHGLPESARAEARQALVLLRRELAPVDLP
jgi:Domain of unknown function (DUF4129)